MAVETVDTRVVEAKFDSKQFEKGVDKTVKKLDELKKSLNLKDSEKSIAEIGNKISETSEKTSDSLEKLEKRFTSFFGMLKQKMISGIADEIVGSLFKMKNAVLGFVQTLSTGQIGYGMQRYTDILTSVRTLTAAGVQESAAYSSIKRLGDYADQTSYSLDNLVDTMSKFKTAGADINTAQRMVEGLSNAAASMGVNAQDATRAYLNMQQAYSKGRMTQADWISFESLPMVGEKFNEAILKAAVKVGTLKESKKNKGTYEIDTKGIKAGGNVSGVRMSGAATKGITAQNMGTKLASGWFDKRVMEEVFGSTYYFAEVGIDEVNKIKAEERKIRDGLRKSGVKEAELDAKTTEELQKYFDKESKSKIDAKKAEIEERKKTAKAELEAKKINQADYKKAKEEYDKLIKDLDKEMKDFEANNHLSAFAYQAFTAGQEARSFNDVMNTLKDTISRGWATSFELIFGKLDEAKDFFTSLTESQFAEGIYRIGEFRNLVLENWRNYGGRDNLLDFLQSIDDIFGSIYKKIGLIEDEEKKGIFDQAEYDKLMEEDPTGYAANQYKNWAESIDPFKKMAQDLGLRLNIMTRNIKLFIEDVKHWLTDIDSYGSSRLQRISNILEGFGKVGSGALKAVGMGLEFLGKLYTQFKPAFDALWKVMDEVSAKYFDVFDQKRAKEDINIFQVLADTFANILTATKPLVQPLTRIIEILGDVLGFISDMAISTFLTNITFFTDAFALLLEILGLGSAQQKRGAGVLDGIVAGIKDLGNACKEAFSAVSEFVNSAFSDLKNALGIGEDANGEDINVFANIENWFNTNEFVQKVEDWFDKAIADIGDFVKDLPNRITDIGIKIGDAFKGLFFEKKLSEIRYDGNRKVEIYAWVKKPLTQWIINAADAVWNFITVDIPKFVTNIPNLLSEFLNSMFYTKKIAKIDYANGKRTLTYVRTPLKKWIDNVLVEVKKFVKQIPTYASKLPSIIGEFFKSIFYEKQTRYNGSMLETKWVKKPFTQWVDENIVKNLKTFIDELPTYIGQAIGTVSNFAGQVVSAIFGKTDGSPVTADDVTEGIRKPFLGVNVTGIINSIKGVAKRILSGVASAFTGQTDWESNKNWLAEGVGKLLDNIKTKAEEVWDKVRDFFADLPNKITAFFEDSAEQTGENGTIWNKAQEVIDGIGKWISTIPGFLLNAWQSATALSAGLWDQISKWITGGLTTSSEDLENTMENRMKIFSYMVNGGVDEDTAREQVWRDNNPIAANLKDFFEEFVNFIDEEISSIPDKLKDLWDNVTTIYEAIKDVLTQNVSPETQEGNPLYNLVTNVFGNIVQWVRDEIPKVGQKIAKGWSDAITIGKIIGDVLFGDDTKEIFSQKKYNEILGPKGLGTAAAEAYRNSTKTYGGPLFDSIATFFDHVRDWIRDKIEHLPEAITNGWNALKNLGSTYGPVIIEGLNKGLDWIKDRFGDLTSALQNPKIDENGKRLSIIDQLTEHFTDAEGNVNPLWAKIREFGENLGDFLVKTIPEFISSAVSRIAEQIPTLLSGLFNGDLFSNKNGSSDKVDKLLGFSEEDVIDGAESAINQFYDRSAELAEKYGVTVDKVEKMLSGSNNNFSSLMDIFMPKAYAGDMATDEDYERVEKQLKIQKQIDAYNEEIRKLEEKKRKEYVYGTNQYSEAEDSINKYKELIKELENGMVEPASEAGKDVKKNETNINTLLDGAGSFVKGFGDVISTVSNTMSGETGQTIAKFLAISALLYIVRDILSLTDEIEAVKSLVISLVFGGLVALVGYITYIATMGTDQQFQNVEKVFGHLKTIMELVVALAAVWKGGSALDSLFDWLGGRKNGKALTQLSGKGDIAFNGLITFLSSASEKVVDAAYTPVKIGGIADVLINSFEEAFGAIENVSVYISQGIDTLLVFLKPAIEKMNALNNQLPGAIEAIPQTKKFIDEFLSLFVSNWMGDKIVDNVSLSNANGQTLYASYIGENVDLLYTISALVNNLSNALRTLTEIENPQEQISKALEVFAPNDEGLSFSDIFEEILGLFENSYFRKLITGGIGDVNNLNASSVKMGLGFISDTLSIFATTLKDVPNITLSELNSFFIILRELLNNTWISNNSLSFEHTGLQKWILGDTSLSSFGQVLSLFVGHLVSVFTNLKEIQKIIDKDQVKSLDQNIEDIKKIIKLVGEFSNSMLLLAWELDDKTENFQSSSPGQSYTDAAYNYLDQITGNDQNKKKDTLKIIQEVLPGIAQMIGGIITGINNFEGFSDINFDNIKNAIDSLDVLVNMIQVDLSDYLNAPEKLDTLANALFGEDGQSGFIGRLKDSGSGWSIDSFGGIEDFVDMLYKLSDAVQTFYEVDDSGKFRYETTFSNIAEEMLRVINTNLTNDGLTPKITPVLDISKDFRNSAEEMQKLLGVKIGEDGTWISPDYSVTISGIDLPQLNSIDEKLSALSEIKETLNQVRTVAGEFNTSLSKVQFVVNSRPFVATIGHDMDQWLGQEGMYIVRANYNNGSGE